MPVGMTAHLHVVCEPVGNQPCTPDSTASCCDTYGVFLTTVFSCFMPITESGKKMYGYCKAGHCVPHVCKKYKKDSKSIRSGKPSFCGASHSNPCKATCRFKSSGKCFDTMMLPDGGENLEDGAICLKDRQKGVFR